MTKMAHTDLVKNAASGEKLTQTPVATSWDVFKAIFRSDIAIFVYIAAFSCALKFKGLCKLSFVLWDEHHFGGFMSHYLRRIYFFDVHPPLGRLLVTLGGFLIGLDPSFTYESGSQYPERYRYCAHRVYQTIFSSISPAMAYVICKQLGLPKKLAIMTGVLSALESGISFYGRIVILDSFLLSFISAALGSMLYTFNISRKGVLSPKWVLSSIVSGIILGISSSIKYSGAFGAIYICAITIESLWNIYTNKKRPLIDTVKTTLVYAFSLILIPSVVTFLSFFIHLVLFKSIDKTTTGVLPDYLSTLQLSYGKGSGELLYGGAITFTGTNNNTSNLHSHRNKYPGTDYFQVTCYTFIDENNNIELRPVEYTFYDYDEYIKTDIVKNKTPIKNGDYVVLRHSETGGIFGVSGVQSPTTKSEYRVEGSPARMYKGDNDHNIPIQDIAHNIWVVKDTRLSDKSKLPLRLSDSDIVFTNLLHNCTMRMSGKSLPYRVIRQDEVTCRPDYLKIKSGTIWHAIMQDHPESTNQVEGLKSVNYPLNIWNLIGSTFAVNNSLVSPPECFSDLSSNPLLWPFSRKFKITLFSDSPTNKSLTAKYNSVFLITSSISIIISTIMCWFFSALRRINTYKNKPTPSGINNFLRVTQRTLAFYYVNYIPYIIMSREKIIHHYVVPLYFSIMNFVALMYFVSLLIPQKFRDFLYAAILVSALATAINYWKKYMWL